MTHHGVLASVEIPEVGSPSRTIVPAPHSSSSQSPLQLKSAPANTHSARRVFSNTQGTDHTNPQRSGYSEGQESAVEQGVEEEDWNEGWDVDWDTEDDMLERPSMHQPTDGRSQVALLKDEERGGSSYDSPNGSARPPFVARRSTFRSRSPDYEAQTDTRGKYIYAGFFLVLSLIAFVVQTETAAYIQHTLGWKQAYCMLYLTHGSWSLLWPAQLLVLRFQKRKVPWKTFWRRHTHILRTTAQMVESQDLQLRTQYAQHSPIPYMIKTTAYIATFLTIAGGSCCSAFFAYIFSIPLLKDKLRFDKLFSVGLAIIGVLIVAYGDIGASKPIGESGISASVEEEESFKNRALGNIIIGVGSVLYGLYEVLYKKYACPPEGTSPGRGMIFAMTFGSMIGCFTLFVLWIPLPILHFTGLETFKLPPPSTAWVLLISVLANATFSGSFLVLISLTSPVLSSVAALLTVFIVPIVDWMLPGGQALSGAAIAGILLIIGAFVLLSWSTYREMDEERRKKLEDDIAESDIDD